MTIKSLYTSCSSGHPKSSKPRYPLTHYPSTVLKHLRHRTAVMTEADKVTEALDETEMIAPDGDVILIVGPGKVRLRVHAHALKMASKVFSAMLGPHFREGQERQAAFLKQISIPDDDAEVMTTICNVIHHHNDLVPDVLSPKEVVKLAITADKYDCAVALKHAMAKWLELRDVKHPNELLCLMAAAYLFNNAKAFEETTRELIFNHRHCYITLAEGDYGDILPWKTFGKPPTC